MKSTIYLSLILLLLISCGSYNNVNHIPSISGKMVDNNAWYSDVNNSVLEMNVEIPNPNSALCAEYNNTTGPLRPCTLTDINHDLDALDSYEPYLNVKMFTNDFILPNEQTNASFEIKGKSTRKANQKSYRIKLDSKTNLYNDERTYQLNKHAFDFSRIRQKMAFDFFIDVPNFTSLKTRFVHLKIDNIDYGLFTHVEHAGKEFLLNRGWNKDDNLYKAQNFSFRVTSELTLDASGEPVNLSAFNNSIEIFRGKKQTKLLEMLEAINAKTTDAEFDQVFNKYFNRDNYLTWMALNIITGNHDTNTQNFFLLNPLYSDTFYFLPWDYDDAGNEVLSYPKWKRGFALWWDVPLHRKFLSIKKNRDDLLLMVNSLRSNYLTDAILKTRLDAYKLVIESYVTTPPDSYDLSAQVWEADFNALYTRFTESIQGYIDEFGSPMPFWQATEYANGVLKLIWDRSVDLEGDKIVYSLQVADNIDMNNLIVNEANLSDVPTTEDTSIITYVKNITLAQGTYYMKVVVNEENNVSSYQMAFDEAFDRLGNRYDGILEFNIK